MTHQCLRNRRIGTIARAAMLIGLTHLESEVRNGKSE